MSDEAIHAANRPLIELTEASQTGRITVRTGQHLRLALPETPTTGYRWRLVDPCAQHLHLQSDAATADGDKPGAAGQREWIFVAKASGTCEMKVESARSWESVPTGKALTFSILITT